MNIERLLDNINEATEAYNVYAHSSASYYRKHGRGVNIDSPKGGEARHVADAYHWNEEQRVKMWALFYVLEFTPEQTERAYTAARMLKRWYVRTQYERFPRESMLKALEAYVMTGKGSRS